MSFFSALLSTNNEDRDEEENPTPPPPPEASNPTNEDRPNTRSRTATRNLQLHIPYVPGPNSIAARGRRASRSPQPAQPEQFFPANTTDTMATSDQLTAIREQLRNELRDEVRNELRSETAAAAAAIPDAIRKKPEIPQFDKAHIEIWIKRTENAFIRANISAVNEKFAFLETKFPVGFDPRIDEYLYGDANDTNWSAFLAYLRKEYGTTRQQRASIFIDGFKRDGRRPSQYAAALDDKTKDVTLDDIKKEMLLREMPTDVRRMLQERIDGSSFKEAAKIADNYFDAEGRPKHCSQTPNVSQVSKAVNKMSIHEPIFTSDDEEPDTNAVGFRKKHAEKRPTNRSQQSYKPATPQQSQNSQGPQNQKKDDRSKPTPKTNHLCHFHKLYGDTARTCKMGCPRFPKIPSNYQAGRQT